MSSRRGDGGGCKVLFTAHDDGEETAELPREHLRIAYPYEEGDDDDDEEEGDEEGYFVAEDGIPVGAELLGRKSDDGQYHDVVIEEVTDTGYRVLFAYEGEDGDREELLTSTCATIILMRRRRRRDDEEATRTRRATRSLFVEDD